MNTFLLLLGNLQQMAINDWIGPAFIIGVAAYALFLLKDRKIRELLIFGVIAGIAGVYIFAGDALFGSKGTIKNTTEDIAKKVKVTQTIDVNTIRNNSNINLFLKN